jgi:hypothetical protein
VNAIPDIEAPSSFGLSTAIITPLLMPTSMLRSRSFASPLASGLTWWRGWR